MAIEFEQEIKSSSLSLEQQVFLLRVDNLITELGHRVSSIRCLSEQPETTLHNGTKTTKISDKISKTLIVDTVVSETECPTVTELRTDIMESQKGKNRWQIYTKFSQYLVKAFGLYALGLVGVATSLSETTAMHSYGHTTEAALYGFITFSASILSLMLATKEVSSWAKDSIDQQIEEALSQDNP